jgi:type II secretory pathway component PulM
MVIVSNSWKIWLAGMAASLIIFAVIFFTVIQPNQNNANQIVKTTLQQTQQALGQAQKTAKQAGGKAGAAAGAQITKAQKLAQCLTSAGTDPSKISACQAKF